MTFTYDGTVDTNLERVRLEIGDTDSTAPLFTDEEINAFLALEANDVLNTALRACLAASRKFARAYDFETDGQAFKRSQMHKAFLDAAKRLQEQGATITGPIAVQTADVTVVDGYSSDIPNSQTQVTTTTRRRFTLDQDFDVVP